VERNPVLVHAARETAMTAGLARVEVVAGDAAVTDAYEGAVPADLVLACGVFGNISDHDVRRTVETMPSLCTDRGIVIWTRHRRDPDLTPTIRAWFADAGFSESTFVSPGPDFFAVGIHQLGAPTLTASSRSTDLHFHPVATIARRSVFPHSGAGYGTCR
jgi:hypothetical protein